MKIIYRVSLNALVVGIVLFTLYVIQDAYKWNSLRKNVKELVRSNGDQAKLNGDSGVVFSEEKPPTAKNVVSTDGGKRKDQASSSVIFSSDLGGSAIDIGMIFTKVDENSRFRANLYKLLSSILKNTTSKLAFHIFTDAKGERLAREIFKIVIHETGFESEKVEIHAYEINNLHNIHDTVSLLRGYFSSNPGTYYSDSLFFLSTTLPDILLLEKLIFLDVDTELHGDIRALNSEFDSFSEAAVLGLAHELSPVYRHVLYSYKKTNPSSKFGEPAKFGGFPGFNSGVILMNLHRMRNSVDYNSFFRKDTLDRLTKEYSFKGHLGDQDFYTLIGMHSPELVHVLPCGWNRQLCTWWKYHGYFKIFDNYFECNDTIRLYHGNCNTPVTVPSSGVS